MSSTKQPENRQWSCVENQHLKQTNHFSLKAERDELIMEARKISITSTLCESYWYNT